jgi:penicillin-binding protein 2
VRRSDKQRWRRRPQTAFVRRDRPIRTRRRDRPIVQLPSVALRVAIVVGIALVLFSTILFRLWFLQILSGKEYVARANDNRLRSVKLVAPRGDILDRNGKILVDNRPGLAVGLRPMDVPAHQLGSVVAGLSKILKVPVAKMRSEIVQSMRLSFDKTLTFERIDAHDASGGYDLIVLKEDVTKQVASYILEHQLTFPGVEVETDYLRDYPMGNLAAHVLGFVGPISADELTWQRFGKQHPGDVVGQSGVELTYDQWLRGKDGLAKIEVDANGRPKDAGTTVGGQLPTAGNNLELSIESGVQKAAQNAIEYGINRAHSAGSLSADAGAAVVLDAKTGEIVAMASYPTYDPKIWVGGISQKNLDKLSAKRANHPLIDRADEVGYAVGSTFKPIDAIAGLEEGVITPSTSFFCPGWYQPPHTTDKLRWKCWTPSGHGSVSLVTALAESCDVYFYNVGYAFYGRKGTALENWATSLGLGRKTGIDVPGEAAGRVPTPGWREKYFKTEVDKIWKPGNSINLAIGQGDLESNPLQMAVAYAAIANGGYVVTPHVGVKIVAQDGTLVRKLESTPPKKLNISPDDLAVVQQGLREAASSGIGTSTAVFGGYPIPVAGKTGTAQVFGKSDYAWYASYAPANDPKYVVVVMIEQGGHGGTTAAPAARMIYDALFNQHTGKVTGAIRSD